MKLGQVIRCKKCKKCWQLVKCNNCDLLHPEEVSPRLADKEMLVCMACGTNEQLQFLKRHVNTAVFGELN